jgi:hypothetical protein
LIICVFQIVIYTCLVPNVGGYQQGKGNPNRKAEYINEREKLMFPDVSPGNSKVIVQHSDGFDSTKIQANSQEMKRLTFFNVFNNYKPWAIYLVYCFLFSCPSTCAIILATNMVSALCS